MIRIVHSPAIWAVAAGLFVGCAFPAFSQTIAASERTASVSRSQKQTSTAHVYLLRGLLNIFSLGMDDLAQKIERRGIRTSVHNHSEWETLSDQIAARYKAGNRGAIILVGHSLGADAVMFMGEYLGKKGVPVALIVPFDGTGSFAASSNVQRVMNLTQRDYAYMKRGNGFRGELSNIDVSGQGYGHIDIDKSDRLHNMVINKIVGVVGRGGPRTAAPKPAAPAATPSAAPAAASAPAATPSATPAAASAPVTPSATPAAAPAPKATPAAAPASAPSGSSGSATPPSRSASATSGSASDISSSSEAKSADKPPLRF